MVTVTFFQAIFGRALVNPQSPEMQPPVGSAAFVSNVRTKRMAAGAALTRIDCEFRSST